MQCVLWILCYLVVIIPVWPKTFIHLHEWNSVYTPTYHGIDGRVPTLLKDGMPIAYTKGTRAVDRQEHIMHIHIGVDNNPYWVLETPIDVKFVDLTTQPFISSKSLAEISADDRCPQLDTASRDLLFTPLM